MTARKSKGLDGERARSVRAVADHIARQHRRRSHRPITLRKLELLLYYAQAWHLAWHGRALFRARIVAAPDGPRIPELRRRRA